MNKSFPTLAYFLACLIAVAFFAKGLEFLLHKAENRPYEDNKVQEVYLNKDNTLKYATGACSIREECTFAGCSNEYCTSEGGIFTTCEVKDDHPAQMGYSCSCYQGKCAWIK